MFPREQQILLVFKPREGWNRAARAEEQGLRWSLSLRVLWYIRFQLLGIPEDDDCDDCGGQKKQVEAKEESVHHVAELYPQVC